MKKFTRFSFVCLLCLSNQVCTRAQTVCTFAGEECCGEGITNFQLNGTPAINRTSTASENGGFTNTGVTSAVVAGQTYNVSFSCNPDIVSCNTYNFKVYVDYNHNGVLTDAGEEVASLANQAPGTHTTSFTVPTSALNGDAYMRVILKMGATPLVSGGFCGHSAITPCNIPVDPVGFHGEVENYTLNITGGSGINEGNANVFQLKAFPNPFSEFSTISYLLNDKMPVTLEVYNILGEKIDVLVNEMQNIGQHSYIFNSKTPANGLYFLKLKAGDIEYTKKLLEVR